VASVIRKDNRLQFKPQIIEDKCYIEGYDLLNPTFSFLCNNCLEISNTRLLGPYKYKGEEEVYICGKCVYDMLSQ
jgi:hypothetical protein